MGIQFGGLASGLPPNIVEQIMANERLPIQSLEAKKTNLDSKLKLVDDLEGRMRKVDESLKEIIGTGGFKDYSMKLSTEGIVAATVDPAVAQPGSWSLEVLKVPENAGRITNGFPDKDKAQVGVGYLKFQTPEGEQQVYINDTNNTLMGVAQAVNQANIGIRASVINDVNDSDYPYKLIFSSDQYGNNHNVEFPTVYLLDGDHDLYFDQERSAENGKIKMNGFEIEVDQKKLQDLIPGVNLELLSADPGKVVTVSVTEDYEAIRGKMDEFVTSMNSVLSFIQQQSAINENTDTSKTLGGDSMIRSIEMRLRSLIQSGAYSTGDGINRLSQLGVEYNRNGTLNFEKEKFNKVLQSNPQGVVKFMRGDGSRGSGFINKVRELVQNTVSGAFGVISNRKSGLQNQVKRIDQNIDNKERLLAQKEVQLRNKFSKLEEQMGRLKAQGGAVSAIGGSALPVGQ